MASWVWRGVLDGEGWLGRVSWVERGLKILRWILLIVNYGWLGSLGLWGLVSILLYPYHLAFPVQGFFFLIASYLLHLLINWIFLSSKESGINSSLETLRRLLLAAALGGAGFFGSLLIVGGIGVILGLLDERKILGHPLLMVCIGLAVFGSGYGLHKLINRIRGATVALVSFKGVPGFTTGAGFSGRGEGTASNSGGSSNDSFTRA